MKKCETFFREILAFCMSVLFDERVTPKTVVDFLRTFSAFLVGVRRDFFFTFLTFGGKVDIAIAGKAERAKFSSKLMFLFQNFFFAILALHFYP